MIPFSPSRHLATALFIVSAAALPLRAAEDAPPVDMAQILQALKGLKTQQVQQSKAQKLRALQDVTAAVNNPARAAEIWEDAVRATQFAGASKEATQFREWKDNEGSALRTKEVATALRLHFNWMALTLQRSAGTEVKELLPAVIQHTKDATAAKIAMDQFAENMKKDRDLANSGKHGARERKNNDEAVKKLYDQIASKPVGNGIVAQWLRIEGLLSDAAQGKAKGEGWEMSAGNVDGIYSTIVLPVFREQKDPRILEYWDLKLRLGAEEATRNKLDFEAGKFNVETRPQLLWQRAQDMAAIGQKNRAMSEMFTLVKTYPAHPNAAAWLASLEQQLAQALTPAPAPVIPPAIPAAAVVPPAP